MIVATPELIPVTMPVDPTVATDGLLLLHVPPDGVPDSVVVEPMHTVLLPEIAAVAFTVMKCGV